MNETDIEKLDDRIPGWMGLGELVPGLHVRLRCNCSGFVEKVENKEDPISPGIFTLVMTSQPCKGIETFEGLYNELPEKLTRCRFSEKEPVFPFMNVPAPDWFPDPSTGPRSNRARRHVRIWFKEPVSGMEHEALIPGSLVSGNIYAFVTMLRKFLGKEGWAEILPDKDAAKKPDLMPEDKALMAAEDWLLGYLADGHSGVSAGKCPVKTEKVRGMLKRLAKHPLYNGQLIVIAEPRLTLEKGTVTP